MAVITVRGTASRHVQPDFVVVDLGITHVAADAPSALDVVAERSVQLAALLARLGLQRSDWVTSGVGVAEEFEWRKDTQVSVGYRATTGVAATLRDFDLLGSLMREAVGECRATIRNLAWQVDPDHPQRRELLADAATDARGRAEAYATALGLTLGNAELVSDLPIAAGDGPPPMREMAKFTSNADSAGMEVSGGLIELTAEVYVRFGSRTA